MGAELHPQGRKEELFALALEAGGVGTWSWDRRSGVVVWDATCERIHGLEPGAFGGTTQAWLERLHPDDRESSLDRLQTALDGDAAGPVVYRTVGADGEVRWIEGRGRAVRDTHREVAGVLGVCQDVTERERYRQRSEFVAETGRLLGSSLQTGETLIGLTELAVPRLADWCVIDLVEHGQLWPTAVSHTDPDRIQLLRRLGHAYGYSREYAPARTVATGEIEHLPEITDELVQHIADDEEHLALLRELAPRSLVAVPLRARGRIIGALTLAYAESGRRHTDDDVGLATDLAEHAAIALDNAALYEERSQLVKALQDALAPGRLPELPGVELAARYDPAGPEEVGGDFYDVIATGDGWLVVLGDVRGKGAAAASMASLARHTIRAAATRTSDPAEILAVLNDALVEHDPEESFCTAVCARLTVGEGPMRVRIVCGGHPLPLCLRADGEVERVSCGGLLVGLFDDLALAPAELDLAPGELLLLYTDGITEARNGNEEYGTARLEQVLRAAAGRSAEGVLDHLRADVSAWEDGQADDAVMIVLRTTD